VAGNLTAGAAQLDITPANSQFLFGYPHVERYSTGVHDRLWSSALYISDGDTEAMFIANDIIFVGRDVVQNARRRIQQATSVPADNIMITSTHTHSGPHTVECPSNKADAAVPPVDRSYVKFMEGRIVETAVRAHERTRPVKCGLAIADDTGIGTNRRDPGGPADHQVPVLLVRSMDEKNLACMLVCSMHPTVLHEDSTLISGDFPGFSRVYLQHNVLGSDCVVLHHTGPSGNQSPRYVTRANTFQEAQRLGEILAVAVEKAIRQTRFETGLRLAVKSRLLRDLPRREFPSERQARQEVKDALEKLETLRNSGASEKKVRTAECDWFGAEETLTLAKSARTARLERAYQSALPAEVQLIKVGRWNFVGWPGEVFVEYSLAVKAKSLETFVISLANGELNGYIATREAAEEGGYEASNALFSHEAGCILVDETIKLLKKVKAN